MNYEVTKTGIDSLIDGQDGQDQQLEAIKDGLRVLSGKTGQAFGNLSKEHDERNKILVDMWKEPLDELMANVENREIEKAKKNVYNVRK